jgi:hypothetical protein
VDSSGHIAEQIRSLQRQATRRGQGTAFTLAFLRIIKALRRDPFGVGEPLYSLDAMGLQVRTIAVAPLVIDYAVDQPRAIVYLKVCKLLSGSGL